MKAYVTLPITIAAAVGLATFIDREFPFFPAPVEYVAAGAFASFEDPNKLGWLDDADLTAADIQRIAQLKGRDAGSDQGVIGAMQAGARSGVTRRDFELLQQDRRRAKAAYPKVPDDQLYGSIWLQIDLSARVPDDFCQSGNSNSTQIGDKLYLDGGCVVGVVNSAYPKRADAPTAKRVLQQIKIDENASLRHQIQKWGYYIWSSGDSGVFLINCYPNPLPSNEEASYTIIPGKCVVVQDSARYIFPFTPNDWIDPPFDIAGVEKLPSFKGATKTKYEPPPERPFIIRDGVLARGEKCTTGRLCWSHWNGDGYDNEDIGPANPACWTINMGIFAGMYYIPCDYDNNRLSRNNTNWNLIATYYGYTPQVSPGWAEKECKEIMPKLLTEQIFGLQGQDNDELNRGNLKEVRCTQESVSGSLMLAAHSMPVRPIVSRE